MTPPSDTPATTAPRNTRTMYMHTIDRKAATWNGKEIVLAYRGMGDHSPVKLYARLSTIKKHLAATPERTGTLHGWAEVEVPRG